MTNLRLPKRLYIDKTDNAVIQKPIGLKRDIIVYDLDPSSEHNPINLNEKMSIFSKHFHS